MKSRIAMLTAILPLAAAAQSTWASDATALASDNGTIKTTGPRTGTSGKSFFNVEGDNNLVANASYGVIDFLGSSLHVTGATAVTGLKLTLTESNAAFSTPGSVEVFLASDSSADIQPGTSTLAYTLAATPEGIGASTSFGTLTDLGSIAFNTMGNVNSGTADSLSLGSLSPSVSTFLAGKLTSGGTIRLVLTPNTAATSATWAGFSNTTVTTPGPVLTLTSNGTLVPEPASVGLILAGSLLLIRRRRARPAD